MERPQLVQLQPDRPANVALITGLPWHLSEDVVRAELIRHYTSPTTVRCYTDPSCGMSLGIFYVEFPNSTPETFEKLVGIIQFLLEYPVTTFVYHLTTHNWDREGRLPELPLEFEQVMYDRAVEGYGLEGYGIRAVELSVPNTITNEGIEEMWRLRKKLRKEMINK